MLAAVSTGTPSLRRAAPAEAGVDARVLDGPLARLLDASRTRAAALLVRGRLIWERYADGCDEATRFDGFSIAKAFTAVAAGLLIGDGVIGVDDPASRYLPEWSGDGRRAITIRHLLTMTSGLALDYERFTSADDATLAALAWPLVHRPGTTWCYEQATAHALVPIITRASGRDLLDLLRDRVLGKIGIASIEWSRSAGQCRGHSGILATARELCRFGELLLARGRASGEALIDPAFMAHMLAVDPVTRAARADPWRNDHLRRAYGYLVYLNAGGLFPGVDRDGFALLGRWGNAVLVDPIHDFVFVRLVTPAARKADAALDDNALSITDHGTARLWRTVLRAFHPGAGCARDAWLDARGEIATWARRRGLTA